MQATDSRSTPRPVPLAAPSPPRAPIAAAPAAPTAPAPATAAGLGGALLGYLVVVVLVVTLAPYVPTPGVAPRIRLGAFSWVDIGANVAMFVPLGFCHQLRRPELHGWAGGALLGGALLSLAVETAQLWMPERFASPVDVATNAMGAWIGALLCLRARRALDPAVMIGRLALELPLMGLVYLLIPLGWLGSILAVAQPTPARAAALLALVLFGGSVLGAVQRRHLAPAGVLSTRGMATAAALGALAALAPALPAHPLLVLAAALVAALFTAHRARAPLHGREDRRFEQGALRRAAPFFVAYLLLVAAGSSGVAVVADRTAIVAAVESLAAVTLLGYLVAEALGRRELRLRESAVPVCGIALLAAAAAAILRAGAPPSTAAWLLVVASLAPALYGARLYHLQRGQVRRIVNSER